MNRRKAYARTKLGDHVALSLRGDTLVFASDRILMVSDCSQACQEFAQLLPHGLDSPEMARWLQDDACRELYNLLDKAGFLVACIDDLWRNTIFETHIPYFSGLGLDAASSQRMINGAHVAILGLGGIGSVILQHLVGAGVKTFTFIDHDTVEMRNLNRQFVYERSDVGLPKAQRAADYVRRFFPDAVIETRVACVRARHDLDALKLATGITFFVNAADYPPHQLIDMIYDFCEIRGLSTITGSCGFLEGHYGPLAAPSLLPQIRESHRRAVLKAEATGIKPHGTQKVGFAPLNTIVGALMARDIIEYLAGREPFSFAHHVWIDIGQMRISRKPA